MLVATLVAEKKKKNSAMKDVGEKARTCRWHGLMKALLLDMQ